MTSWVTNTPTTTTNTTLPATASRIPTPWGSARPISTTARGGSGAIPASPDGRPTTTTTTLPASAASAATRNALRPAAFPATAFSSIRTTTFGRNAYTNTL